ncbi:anaphase-promoting complex subunit 2-like [Tigriopus californicus]|nr:anaphase-promoting complex subunit 2-like [Tigriopus californicus]
MSDAEMDDPLDEVWNEMKVHFLLEMPKVHSTPTSWPRMSAPAIAVLREHPKSISVAFEYLQHQLEHTLNEEVVPEFWKIIKGTPSLANQILQHLETLPSHPFVSAVSFLHRHWKRQMEIATKMDALGQDLGHQCHVLGQKSYEELYPVLLRGTLHSQLPHEFEKVLLPFYDATFHVFYVRQNSRFNADPDDSVADGTLNGCEGCKKDVDQCQCDKVLSIFNELNQQLIQMGLLERLTFNALTQTIHNRIEKHVQETCQGSFTISHLQKLEDWLDQVVMSWLRLLYVQFDPLQELALRSFRGRLVNHLYEVYTKTRIDQLFNIIIEFPDSQPALEDLKDCLGRTGLRPTLTENLTRVLSKKLLHLGVNTTDILTAYIAAIRALRVLDPSGVVLEVVCAPVRTYLRTREDTVRCIVQSLIDDSSSELADELKKNEGLSLDDSFYEEQDMDNWESWVPDPIDAPSISKGRRTSDIISMLVNIYGSKELFVNEYRSLLSNRLLSHFTYDTEKEIRNLELLKLRFGDAPLHQCEVMLKDIGDSKRINTSLHSADAGSAELNRQAFPVNAVILSAQFWPQFKQENLQLPQSVAQSLDVYTKAFETVKGNRTLVWKPHLGFANIDLELGDKKINLTVSPVHAAIIYQFQVKAEWTSEELAQTLKIPLATLRRRIVFWQTQGLVREISADRFALIEDGKMMRRPSGIGGTSSNSAASTMDEEDERDSITRNSRDQLNEELNVFWSYIVNMLINLEALTLERIYQMLKMFAMQAPSAVECDINEVRAFLDKKVRDHELVFTGGMYKLPKT